MRKSFDRVGFEADKRMRISRVRAEADKIRDLVDSQTYTLGKLVLDQSANGAKLEPNLQEIVDKINDLQARIQAKQQEIEAINAEVWVAPPPPPPPAIPGPASAPATSPPEAHATTAPAGNKQKPSSEEQCPVCHSALRQNATFCPSCGYKLNA